MTAVSQHDVHLMLHVVHIKVVLTSGMIECEVVKQQVNLQLQWSIVDRSNSCQLRIETNSK